MISGAGDVMLTPEQLEPLAKRVSDVPQRGKQARFGSGLEGGVVFFHMRVFSETLNDIETEHFG